MNKHVIFPVDLAIPPDDLQRNLAIARPNEDAKFTALRLFRRRLHEILFIGQRHQWSLLPYRYAGPAGWRPRSAPPRLRENRLRLFESEDFVDFILPVEVAALRSSR